MPLYEYKCKQCDAKTIISKSINDSFNNPKCDTCNIELNRVYSSVGVTFNGGGFYRTDNRKG